MSCVVPLNGMIDMEADGAHDRQYRSKVPPSLHSPDRDTLSGMA